MEYSGWLLRMKENEIKLLAELLKNSKKSDRELGKTLRLSQPTVSRIRSKLEREGIIREYTIIPDFTKLGFELFSITTIGEVSRSFTDERFQVPSDEKHNEKAAAWMKKLPNVILSSRATGMGKSAIIVSLHRNFTDYEKFIAELKSKWIDRVESIDSILVSMQGFVAKPFSLKYLAEILSQ